MTKQCCTVTASKSYLRTVVFDRGYAERIRVPKRQPRVPLVDSKIYMKMTTEIVEHMVLMRNNKVLEPSYIGYSDNTSLI